MSEILNIFNNRKPPNIQDGENADIYPFIYNGRRYIAVKLDGKWVYSTLQDKLDEIIVGDSQGANRTVIDKDGFQRMYRNATAWDDLRVPGNAAKRFGIRDPDLETFLGSLKLFAFSPLIYEEVFFSIQLPHSYEEGTDIFPHVHWSPDGNGGAGEKVSWGLEYTWANIGDVFGAPSTIYGDTPIPDETLVDRKHYVTSLGTIDGDGKKISSMLACRLFRDATGAGGTDDYGNDAFYHEFDIHFQIDTIGSKSEFVKYN